jgi:rifampicin phosphotransferase
VETLYRVPQDIEWAIDDGGVISLLQARPITTLEHGVESILDNANVVESYPGLSSPLTFSFARKAYEASFRGWAMAYAVPPTIVAEADAAFQNMLALVNGRIYYNILNWYRIFTLVPGFEGFLPAWEKGLGLTHLRRHPVRRRLGEWLRISPVIFKVILHILWQIHRIPVNASAYRRSLVACQSEVAAADLLTLDAHDLLALLEVLERRLLAPYSVAIVNDAITQQLYDVLAKVIASYGLGDPLATRNGLLAGERDMESVEPVRSLLALAERVRNAPALKRLFESGTPAETIWQTVQRSGEYEVFRAGLADHLAKYGDRTLHELKLETLSAAENPEFVVAMLQNYLRGGQTMSLFERREEEIRSAAEDQVRKRLGLRLGRRLIFDSILSRVRNGLKTRESLRLARSRAFGMVKRIYSALGVKLVQAALLTDVRDVFWLTADEVAGVVRGAAATRDTKGVVAQRKAEYARFRETALAPRITTNGIVYRKAFPPAEEAAGDGVDAPLRRTGC